MPELPDVTVYIEALEKRLVGDELVRIRFGNPFLLRTVSPTPEESWENRSSACAESASAS
jgi:formamidopyrimidine-DNA glycosylase